MSIDSDQQDQQEQQTESQPDALPVPTECSATSPINGVKKEPEKSAPEAAAVAPDEVTTNAVAPAVPKRGRGRAKKIKPDADATLELTEASTVSTQTATANDEASSSTPTPPPATAAMALERKVGRGKRKLPEEEQQLADLPAAALIVKTEQDEDMASVSAPPSGDAKRMRRSVRLGNRQDLYKPTDAAATAAANSWSAEEVVKSEPLVATELASNVEPSLSVATGALLDEKTPPKKRGRKAKVPATASNPAAALQSLPHATTSSAMMTATGTVMAVAGNSSSSGGGGGGSNNGGANIVVTLPNGNKRSGTAATLTTLTATGSGELQLPKRSKRRIKPTTKILENDELRCEFETKHIERMTHWEATAAEGEAGGHFETPTLQQTFSGGGGGGGSNSSTSRQKSEKSDGGGSGGGGGGLGEHHPAGTSAIKKRLFSKSQRDIDNSGAALVALSLLRPCPDLEQFMNEIKASKWNANRSPEERKLNKKQQRKLAKRKEKHLKYLGLRRNNSEEASDNDSSNTDNEEFVPTTRVQVGKPSVTLRQRNAGKEARQSLAAAAAASSSLPAAPASMPGGKLTRRVGAVRGGAASAAAAAASTTLEQSQLHSLNSAILAGNNNNAGDGLGASTSTAAAAAVKFICLCQKGSQYYARNAPDASFCCAIDNIDEQKIGCCNELSAEVHNLLRPSQRVGYMILCDEHKKRLQAHNCCAGCGIFCTQVRVVDRVLNSLRLIQCSFFSLNRVNLCSANSSISFIPTAHNVSYSIVPMMQSSSSSPNWHSPWQEAGPCWYSSVRIAAWTRRSAPQP